VRFERNRVVVELTWWIWKQPSSRNLTLVQLMGVVESMELAPALSPFAVAVVVKAESLHGKEEEDCRELECQIRRHRTLRSAAGLASDSRRPL
jgi:hypothetical protein